MDSRRVCTWPLGPADAALRREWKLRKIRFVRGVLLALFFSAIPIGLKAEERPPATRDAAAGEAVNIMWRFDGNGRFPSIDPPSEWRTDKNILWKTSIDIGGYSSPIVVRDRVFLTAEMGSLICLDLADGKILWTKDLFSRDSQDIPAELSPQLMRGCGGESKQSTPTPTSNGELVFYINAMGLCACYDLQGNRKWIRIIETAEEEECFTSSPIFVGDKIVLTWGCLLALDARDGTTLWKDTEALPTYGTPAIANIGGEKVAVTPAGNIVRLADGEVLSADLFEAAYSTPLVEGNVLYVIDARARALELPAQAEKGMRLKELWQTELGGELMASPVYRDGRIYTIENKKCRLHIIDARTGKILTTSRVVDEQTKAETIEPGVKIDGLARAQYAYASPVATDRHVFFFDDAGNAAVLEVGREYRLVRVNKLEGGIVGTPFFVEDKIIIRGTETVYCIGKK
jgi:outer membrane protein assembly factor BamB